MKQKTIFLTALFWVCFSWFGNLQAQTSMNTSGGEAAGNEGQVSYSVGQVAYTAIDADVGYMEQGVQHAYEIYSLGVSTPKMGISLRLYPNPTGGWIHLQLNKTPSEELFYRVYDMLGRLLFKKQITARNTKIDLSALASATYYLRVTTTNNRRLKTFKIIKK